MTAASPPSTANPCSSSGNLHVSRLTSVTGPDGHRLVYSYDQQGNLVSARDLITGDTSRYGYDTQNRLTLVTKTGQPGSVIEYPDGITRFTFNVSPLTSDLGAALNYLVNPYTTTLTAGSTDLLAFSLRPSELNASTSGDVYVGVIVEANAGSSVLLGIPTIAGLTPVASHVTGNSAFALFRVEREGMQLLQIAGANGTTSGAYSVKLFIAGDANRDTTVDALDASLIEAALGSVTGGASYNANADANRDGVVNSTDIHFYRQDLGFVPNQAPVVLPITAAKTHIDLEIIKSVDQYISDQENDPVFYRITGATNGTARIASDGSSVSFTPTTGYSGPASFSIVADDGYSTSQVATVTVNVSAAPLVKLDFVVRQPRLDARHSMRLQLVGDFTDEQNVALPASYLQFQVSNPSAASLTNNGSRFTLNGLANGTGVITASTAHGPGGVTIQAATAFSVGIPTDQTQQFLYALGQDVFPGAVSLATGGGQRQILADLADTIQLTNGSTGTRYFVSNPNVITVSADGLITAGQAGEAVVTVINGPAESLIPVKVQAPNVGPTLIGTEGGIVQGTNGYQVAIAPDALAASTLVSITPVTQASLLLVMPGPFQYVSSFDLQIGDGRLATPAQLAIPITGSTLAPNSDIVFFRYSTLLDETGSTFGVWMQEETGIFGADGVARTTSPPFPGVLKSGTWMIGAAPAGSVARVDGEIDTFFPNQGSHFTVVAQTAGAPIARDVNSPVQFYLPMVGPITINTWEYTQYGQANVTTTTVQAQAGVNTKFNQTVINTFVDDAAGPSGAPVIETTQVVITGGEATLILTGSRFTFDVIDPSAPNIGASILDLVVNFDVPIRPDQFTQAQLDQFTAEGKPVPTTYRVTATPDPLTSSGNTVHVKVPNGVILGLADVSVTRKTPVLQSTSPNVWKVEDRTSETTTIESDPHILFAANNFDKNVAAVDISKNPATGLPRNQVITRIAVGDPTHLGPTRAVAVTPDLTRAYVTVGSGVAVIDVQTLQEVDLNPATAAVEHIIEIPGAHPYWAVADKDGNYLYVSDTFVGTIYVIDINPTSATFHTVVKQISVDVASEGLRGMDITADGRRLYAAAPLKGGAAQFSTQNYPNGHIVVIDIDTQANEQTLWTTIAEKTVSQEPYFVQASATDPRVVTFTNRRSDSQGFNVIHATNDAHTNLTITSASLLLGSKLDNFDVNDASAIALLPAGTLPGQTKDYAFVTGWNRIQQDIPSRDPFLVERFTIEEAQSSGFVLNAPVGGNIGVIEDPFGTPKLIAATAGQFLSMPDGLTLSADGKTLYAAFSADNAVRVFDVQKIVTEVTKSANLVKQITRRDGTFNLLEISPLAGPSGIGPINNPLNASIELAPIGTGRFPQGLAIAESSNVTIGFGRENDAISTEVLATAEPGDTTPVFRWKVDWADPAVRNSATSKLFLSVLPPGKGLFPGDFDGGDTDAAKDLGRHRILNGVTAVHRFTQQGDIFEFDLEPELARALTLGQTYYIGVKIFDGNENPIATASRSFKLEQPAPTDLTKFSSVTVLTHGFQPEVPNNSQSLATNGQWLFDLADQIENSGGGDPTTNILVYNKRTGGWEGARDDQGNPILPSAGKPLVLLTDWWRESDISDSGFSEAAADAFFASLVELNSNSTMPAKIFNSPLHFIGHSRGTVVTSELLQRLGEYENRVLSQQPGYRPLDIQLTLLDVHDELNGPQDNLRPLGINWTDFNEPVVKVWQNIGYADNYYQTKGDKVALLGTTSVTPNGREVVGADLNVNLNGLAGFISDDANYEFDASADATKGFAGPHTFLGPHSRVWRWYAGTTDLNIQSFERTIAGNEPIFRSLQDVARFSPPSAESIGGGGDLPWYVPLTFSVNYYAGQPALTPAVQNAVWEGIGLGWWYSELGGGVSTRPPANLGARIPVANDNTSLGETPITPNLTVWNGSAVPSVFNGDFEAGNMQRNVQGLYAYYRGDSTPGWAFHQTDFNDPTPAKIVSYPLTGATIQGHAAEISTDGDIELVHNRFYIPSEATIVQFNYDVREVEFGQGGIPRQPELSVILRVDGVEHPLGTISSTLTTPQVPPNGTADFLSKEITIPQDLRGKVGELIFRLSFIPGQPSRESGHARIWIDNVRLGPSGAPLQAESTVQIVSEVQGLTAEALTPLVGASRMGWLGVIETPDGSTGVSLGNFGITTPDLFTARSTASEDGNTGGGQRGLDDQGLLANFDVGSFLPTSTNQKTVSIGVGSLGSGLSYSASVADQVGRYGDPSFTTDSHAIQTRDDSGLFQGQSTALFNTIVNEHGALQSPVDEGRSTIDDRTIGIADVNIRGNFASPGGDGAITDLDLFKLKELALQPFPTLPGFRGEHNRLIEANFFIALGSATDLAQGEDQQNQTALQHSLSFGTLTLPPDRDVVNNSEAISYQPSALSFDQLALLNQATITIADLADGYLALTLGTTITLDTDAAGYSWFIDPTPFTNEEFVNGGSMVDGQWSIGSDASPWQFIAKSGSAADGKIDLMTVLMHELGHVMGLGHVSSAVDGTRLMAGSIDPGIRRLPSSLDLGMVDSDHDHDHSAPSTQNSALPTWAPYLAHYTTASDATPATPLTPINPSRLVQAAQLPSHAGIFNSNFAISDPLSATFGWDQSGGVSIANGQAVLSEDARVLSTLSQTFTLPAGSTHLRFTILNSTLNTNNSTFGPVPPDAFEVALLESGTMTPLAGVVSGLDHTDSLLNIQADGTIYKSSRVTITPFDSALSTQSSALLVDIDLTGLTAGAGARLSFDLLGFGDRTSTIVLDNVLLTDGAPTAAPIAVNDSYTVAEGASVFSLQSSGLLTNDSDSDTPAFGLTALLLTAPTHGTLTLNADGSFTYVHNGSETLTDSFTYRVSDGINFSNLATVSLTVTPTNDAPVIAAIPAQSVEQGRTLTVNVSATDPDDSNLSPESNILTFSLQPNTLAGASIDPATGLFTWAVARTQTVGFYTITVNVTDAGTPALSASRSVTVEVKELTNTPPTLDSIGSKTVNEETELRFTIFATDLDVPAQPLTFSATPLPPGATFTPATGEFAWTPTEAQGPGSYVVTFSVSDGAVTTSEVVTITVGEVNVAPVLAPIGPKSVDEETELRFTISATDVDLPAQLLTFSASGLPTGATFDVTTHEFVWTPTELQGPGSYNVTFSVTDGVVTASELVIITVNEVNIAPVLNAIGPKSVNEQTELRFTISGSDVDDPAQTLVYSATGLPAGATFDPTTREFAWTPTETQGPGSYLITFSITDGVVTTSEAVTITVGEVNIAPVLAPIGSKSVNEESELRFTISGSDVDDPAQTLVYSATGMPTGASFNVTTREFAWTPTEIQGPGTYTVTFSVTDGVVTTSETITITVNEVNKAPVLAPIGNKSVNEGALLSFTASATDADIPVQTLTYSLAADAPAGASIHPTTGIFTWTPIEGPGASPYSVTVQVSDGVVTTSETIGITVLNVAPTVSLIPATNVQEGVSASYSLQFQDPGILDTHTIQINWGDGSAVETITSAANAAGGVTIPRNHTYADGGTYSIAVTVADDEGEVGTASAVVVVHNVAPGVTLTPATQTKQYSDPITPIVITATDVTADTLNVTTAWSTNGTTFTAGLPDELTITGGLALTGAANQVGTGSWTISGMADLDPAKTYTIRVTVADEDGGSTVQQSVIDLDQEDARVTYDGVLYASTPSINTTTTTIQLRATVQDITAVLPASDADAGLITKATVTFINRDTNTVIAANVPITLLNPADPKTGTAVYNWTVTLPNNSNSESYTIGTLVNGYYTRNASADNTVVTVSLPQNDFLTGGGYLINQSSAGTYAGDAGQKTNFGFNVKFNKQLTNLQGKANIIIRQGGQSYQVKTNATNSLSTTEVSPGVYDATFTSKANLTNITDPLNPISLGGNLDLIVILRDAGEPGTADTIGMTLWQGSTLLYSSNWTGTQTVKQLLGGGNLQVRTSSPLLAAEGAQADEGSIAALTAQQLSPIVDEAKARWIASGLTAEQVVALASVRFTIADLYGATLGLTDGASVLIDRTAAGHGWFIDPTPHDHAEFHFVKGLAQWIADAHSLAFSRMDLLTTVMHEIGHALGVDDQQAQKHSANLMTETLPTGVRRSLLTDLPAGPVGQYPSSGLSVKEMLDRSLKTFAGSWGNNGNGSGVVTPSKSRTTDAVAPVINWDDLDAQHNQRKISAIGASGQKASWLQRFLLHMGREESARHDHEIEVVLPGKKK